MDAKETNEQFARRMQDKRVGWQLWELMAWNDRTSQFEYLYSLRRDTESESSVWYGLLTLVKERGMLNDGMIPEKRPIIRRAPEACARVLMPEIRKMLDKKNWGRQGVIMPAWRNVAVIEIGEGTGMSVEEWRHQREEVAETLRSTGEENPLVTKLKRATPGLKL